MMEGFRSLPPTTDPAPDPDPGGSNTYGSGSGTLQQIRPDPDPTLAQKLTDPDPELCNKEILILPCLFCGPFEKNILSFRNFGESLVNTRIRIRICNAE